MVKHIVENSKFLKILPVFNFFRAKKPIISKRPRRKFRLKNWIFSAQILKNYNVLIRRVILYFYYFHNNKILYYSIFLTWHIGVVESSYSDMIDDVHWTDNSRKFCFDHKINHSKNRNYTNTLKYIYSRILLNYFRRCSRILVPIEIFGSRLIFN